MCDNVKIDELLKEVSADCSNCKIPMVSKESFDDGRGLVFQCPNCGEIKKVHIQERTETIEWL